MITSTNHTIVYCYSRKQKIFWLTAMSSILRVTFPAVEHSTIYHFADDTNILYSCKSLKTLRKAINMDLQLLYEWLCANRLSLNAGKTECIVFRPVRNKTKERLTLELHHTKLFESSKIKYLGLILDNKLNWKAHITELSEKLGRAVGLI